MALTIDEQDHFLGIVHWSLENRPEHGYIDPLGVHP